MHVLQDLLLWLFISGLAVGGALAFLRFFPRESPWFGFIVPPLALVALLNFIEHFVPVPNLLILAPLLAGGLVWLAAGSRLSWRPLMLPAGIFLGSFAFTYFIRCLQPDILPSSDGISDLNKINNYCQGNILPPIDTWLPPFHYVWYYSLQHYAASIIKRLFDVQLGVAYNAAHAFLSALTCVAGAAAAHRLSGGRLWVAVAVPFLIESAATGSSAYIHLFMRDPSMWYANNLSGGVLDYDQARAAGTAGHANPLWPWLAHDPYRERLELQVPGFWTWRDEYHANSSGHFLTLLAVFIVAELTVRRSTAWPWVLAVLTPILAVDASTWAYPITLLLCGGAVALALWQGHRPASLVWPGVILFGALLLLWPSLYDVTSSPEVPEIIWTKPEWRVAWREFLVQWWPIILLWGCGCVLFGRISFGVRWILFVIPLMLIGVELITVEGRYNTVEKMWGYTYGTGLIALFPIVATFANFEEPAAFASERMRTFWLFTLDRFEHPPQWTVVARVVAGLSYAGLLLRGLLRISFWRDVGTFLYLLLHSRGRRFKVVVLLLLFCSGVSLFSWMDNTWRWAPWKDTVFHLEGDGYVIGKINGSEQKRRMLQLLMQVKHATFLSGRCAWCYNESPTLATFTGNRSYSAWFYFESVADYPEEAEYRAKLNNDFYAGALADPLKFLRENNITGVIIWPDDVIPDDYLATLEKALAPDYEYIDCKADGPHNAGVFLRRPLPPEVRLP